MLSKNVRIGFFSLCAAGALLLLGCAGTVQQGVVEDESGISDAEFIKEIKQKIDYLVRCEDAFDDIEAVRGKVVKWHGEIVRIWNDKIQVRSSGEIERWNNFIFLLDHPLPRESRFGESTQTISERETIYVVGRIMDLENVIFKDGTDLTIPHLKGYIISKDHDRNLLKPAWVGHKM
jgi:hypothetical protein